MIKFFRHFRQHYISEDLPARQTGKTGKYFKYAIGEIILLVIGILIALQINNWKEYKQKETQIKNALVALHNDLAQDTFLIKDRLPFIKEQYQLNESLRSRVAKPKATLDTLMQIMRYEFNPNWSEQIIYNTNAYYSLIQTGLVENVPDSLKTAIKTFYNQKFFQKNRVEKTTTDYREKITSYVNTYTFGSTPIHDQGPLIDSLVWEHVDISHLATTFQGISNFKRILFAETQKELEYSLAGSKRLLQQLDSYIKDL